MFYTAFNRFLPEMCPFICSDDSKIPQNLQKNLYFWHIIGKFNPLKHIMVLFFQFQKALIYTVILRHQPAS